MNDRDGHESERKCLTVTFDASSKSSILSNCSKRVDTDGLNEVTERR